MKLYKIIVEDAVIWDWTYIICAENKKVAKELVLKEYSIINTQGYEWTSWMIEKIKDWSCIKLKDSVNNK